jgi:ketosteroid isomerase-like protein
MAEFGPEEMHKLFADYFNAGDLDSLVGLYEEKAILATYPDHVVRGSESIRDALQDFLALKGKIEIKTSYVLRSGDIALLSAQWHLKGTSPEGNRVEMSGKSAEIARHQSNGKWLYVVDHAFGAQSVES